MKNLLQILLISSLFIGCSSNNDDEVTPEDTTPILPTKILHDSDDFDIFKYDNDKLTELSNNEGKEVFTYVGDNISKSVEYDLNGTRQRTWEYTYNTNDLLAKIKMTTPTGSVETTTLTWIDANHYKYTRTPATISSTYDVYLTNNNITKITRQSSDGTSSIETISYDSGNNPIKNMKGFNKINIMYPADGSSNCIVKDQLTYTSSTGTYITTTTYTNTYNSNNFPSKSNYVVTNTAGTKSYTYVFEYNK